MAQIKLLVEKLASGGLGLARNGGEVLLLPGALPGEEVLAEPGEMVRGARRGKVMEIVSASPFRVERNCPLAGRCGGCDFSHVHPGEALRLKSEAALGELARAAGVGIELIESPLSEYYRGRATVHLDRRSDGGWGIGFYDARRRLIEFSDCRLLAPELNALVGPLRRWAEDLPPEAGGAEISLLKGEMESGLAIHFSAPPSPRSPGRGRKPAPSSLPPIMLKSLERLPQILAEHGLTDVSILARVEGKGRSRKIGGGGPALLPTAVWPEWGLTLAAAPGAFTQVNPVVNKLMVQKILALAAPLATGAKPAALDLYSGLGNIALPLLKSGFTVTAVEESPDGVEAARANGRGLPGLTVVAGRSEQTAADLACRGQKFDLIVLDPPRAGAPGLAPVVAALKPKMIIYVACHPAVLGRDLPAFASLGYGLRRLAALDMFPRTSHLEALAVFTG